MQIHYRRTFAQAYVDTPCKINPACCRDKSVVLKLRISERAEVVVNVRRHLRIHFQVSNPSRSPVQVHQQVVESPVLNYIGLRKR